MKRITKRYRKDIKLLIERLDKHGDQFRTSSVEMDVKPEMTSRVARPVPKTQQVLKNAEKQNPTGGKKPGPKRKSKADKVNYHFDKYTFI